MKPTLRRSLSVGFVLAGMLTGFQQDSAAASLETIPAVTIHVRNYAKVDPDTLTQAKQVATGIFRKAGVETRWADIILTPEDTPTNSANYQTFTITDIQLNIYPDSMSDRISLSGNVMGLAPGTGPDRVVVYVFDSKVRALSWRMQSAYSTGDIDRHISKGQVLGHAIAHEIGHLMLNQQIHSPRGIMRGEWGFPEMRDATYGLLLFTPQQARTLQAEIRSRDARRETVAMIAAN
jgi:hypothetical protein